MLEVTNKKSKRSYIVEQSTWDQIVRSGKKDKYILVGEIKDIKHSAMVPKEVGEVIKERRKSQNT